MGVRWRSRGGGVAVGHVGEQWYVGGRRRGSLGWGGGHSGAVGGGTRGGEGLRGGWAAAQVDERLEGGEYERSRVGGGCAMWGGAGIGPMGVGRVDRVCSARQTSGSRRRKGAASFARGRGDGRGGRRCRRSCGVLMRN